jgi:hypothetical protein
MLVDDIKKAIDDEKYIVYYGGVYKTKHFSVMGDMVRFLGDRIDISEVSHALDECLHINSTVSFGSDPEFFFKKDGKYVPSKDVLEIDRNGVVKDGFQVEINPLYSTCRESAGTSIGNLLHKAADIGEVSLDVGVEFEDKEFLSLPWYERRFGCNPTLNPYEKTKRVTGVRERFRSGGGHIHLGGGDVRRAVNTDKETLVKLLDILCGAMAVLIDRDPNNVRRRVHYGRAGEHRVKEYGIEYRVPSNFWLRHYVLWSFVSAQARNAVSFANDATARKLADLVDTKLVRDAINNNDKNLAFEVLDIIKKFVIENGITTGSGIDAGYVYKFRQWASEESPIDAIEGELTLKKTMENWETKCTYGANGFEKFLLEKYPNE